MSQENTRLLEVHSGLSGEMLHSMELCSSTSVKEVRESLATAGFEQADCIRLFLGSSELTSDENVLPNGDANSGPPLVLTAIMGRALYYDGLYVSMDTMSNGGRSFLRFYEEGSVMRTNVAVPRGREAQSSAQILKWFNIENRKMKGRTSAFKLKGSTIKFVTREDMCEGKAEGSQITLTSQCRCNSSSIQQTFMFLAFADMPQVHE